MGYYVDEDRELVIPKKNIKKALEAMKAMMTQDEMKRLGAGGGTFGWENGVSVSTLSYSWMNTEEVLKAKTLVDALDVWGFEFDKDRVGDLVCRQHTSDKQGDEEILLRVLAPFMSGQVECRGEDGAMWRWVIRDGKLKEQGATISWED